MALSMAFRNWLTVSTLGETAKGSKAVLVAP
jgi:hypothetical protein